MPTSLTEPDSSGLGAFLGKERVEEEVLSLGQARGLAATLDRDAASLKDGDTLPAGWHWIYFTPTAGRSATATRSRTAPFGKLEWKTTREVSISGISTSSTRQSTV